MDVSTQTITMARAELRNSPLTTPKEMLAAYSTLETFILEKASNKLHQFSKEIRSLHKLLREDRTLAESTIMAVILYLA